MFYISQNIDYHSVKGHYRKKKIFNFRKISGNFPGILRWFYIIPDISVISGKTLEQRLAKFSEKVVTSFMCHYL